MCELIFIIQTFSNTRLHVRSPVLDRFVKFRGVQTSEQRCLPALPDAAWGEKKSAGEEQQTHVALPGQRISPGAPGHQGKVRKTQQ